MHPKLPATGGIFEAFAIELVNADARARVRRQVTQLLGAGWTMRQFGERGTDFELVNPKKKLSPRQAWDFSYALRAMPGVIYAEPLFSVSVSDNPAWEDSGARLAADSGGNDPDVPESDPPEWSLRAIRVIEAWGRFFPDPAKPPGNGTIVGHPDTGYQNHPEIISRILEARGYDFVHGDTDAHDQLERPFGVLLPNPGHGTGTSSVIISPAGAQQQNPSTGWVTGVAPAAMLLPLRTSYSVVLFSTVNLARAIEYAAEHGAHVISISMGGLAAWRLRRAVSFAQSRGVIICAASGNYSPFVVWPAAYDEVIACAASNAKGGVWKHGSHGHAVDVTAPGESVWRATVEKKNGQLRYDVTRGSGTSFATTNTAGLAALWLSYHGRPALVARYGAEKLPFVFNRILRDSCVKFPGWKQGEFGTGLIDAVRTLEAALPDIADDAAPAAGPQLEGHPEIDRGELGTFAHLFGPARISVEEADAFAPDGFNSALADTLAALLKTPRHALPAQLRATGQELAFHLATDPDAYRTFAALLRRKQGRLGQAGAIDDSADVAADEAGTDALRRDLQSRASPQLRRQIAK